MKTLITHSFKLTEPHAGVVHHFVKGILSNIPGHGAMVSDAVHSASDVISSALVMFGISMAAKAEDTIHPHFLN